VIRHHEQVIKTPALIPSISSEPRARPLSANTKRGKANGLLGYISRCCTRPSSTPSLQSRMLPELVICFQDVSHCHPVFYPFSWSHQEHITDQHTRLLSHILFYPCHITCIHRLYLDRHHSVDSGIMSRNTEGAASPNNRSDGGQNLRYGIDEGCECKKLLTILMF
jgi:hypothetical protein